MHAAVTVSSLGPRRANSGFVLVLDDLTELLRAQKAAAWQEVARRIAHEIKNPLTPNPHPPHRGLPPALHGHGGEGVVRAPHLARNQNPAPPNPPLRAGPLPLGGKGERGSVEEG